MQDLNLAALLPPGFLEMCVSRLNDMVLITEAEPQDEPGPRTVFVNEAFVRKTGYSRAEIIGKSPRMLQGPKTSRQELDKVRAALKSFKPVRVEIVNYTKSGEEFWLEMDIAPVANETGRHTHFIAIERDISERKQAEEARQASADRYQALFEKSPIPMWVHDRESWMFLAVNEAAIEKYGYSREEFLSMKVSDIRPPEDIPLLRKAMVLSGEGLNNAGIWRHRTKSGKILMVEIYFHGFVFAGHQARLIMPLDITEKVFLAEQLQQAQKMETIGQLAGGVAHDFNNLLTVINGYTHILLARFADEHKVKPVLGHILRAGERAAELTAQLLAFSRKQALQPKIFNIATALESMRPILERLIREDVEILWNLERAKGAPETASVLREFLPSERNLVSLDPSQFEQVILNLVINARDAMPDGGSVSIETATAYFDESYSRINPDIAAGDYALVRVSDTGQGMSAETIKRIFDPFFTTKEKGLGTGLGLSTVYGIVKQSGGHIDVQSELGVGSRFNVYFPIVQGEPSTREQDKGALGELKGNETILMAEDDAGVRNYAGAILREMGYRLLEASNGNEAIAASEKYAGSIDLLLTDVVMPKLHGHDLAEFLSQHRPGMKVLFMSGYSESATGRRGIPDKDTNFLAKPFSATELLQKVRTVLSTTTRSKTILIVDDEEGIRDLFRDVLEAAGYQIVCCVHGKAALEELAKQPFDLLITDLVMPGVEGIETIKTVRKRFPELKIVATSGYAGGEYLKIARLMGATETLPKPVNPTDLCHKVAVLIGV